MPRTKFVFNEGQTASHTEPDGRQFTPVKGQETIVDSDHPLDQMFPDRFTRLGTKARHQQLEEDVPALPKPVQSSAPKVISPPVKGEVDDKDEDDVEEEVVEKKATAKKVLKAKHKRG